MKKSFKIIAALLASGALLSPIQAANNYNARSGDATPVIFAKCSQQQADSSQADCAVILPGEAHIGEVGGRTVMAGSSVVTPASAAVFTGSISGTTLTVSAVTSGTIAVGQYITCATCLLGTNITAGSGTTWTITPTQTVSSSTINANTPYTANMLIANSATAGSVTPFSFAVCRIAGGTGSIRRARVKISSDTGFSGFGINLVLFRDAPTLTAGDHAALASSESNYLGTIPVSLTNHFNDYEKGIGVPQFGNEINFDCASGSQTIYGLLTAGSTIIPQAGGKTVTAVIEAWVN